MIVLGIETSCDETAVALVNENYQILAQRLTRQLEHERWGGVVPETASRAHLELLDQAVCDVLNETGLTAPELSAVAATIGPGLAGALWVGAAYADGFSLASGIPRIGVHHLEAHLWAVLLQPDPIQTPFLSLLVSGGHTLLIEVRGFRDYQILGTTRDDAVGEAFDKAARLLNLGFPGGPAISAAAATVSEDTALPPLPIASLSPSFDFSYSGLKSALRRGLDLHPEVPAALWAKSFERVAVEALVRPVVRAWETRKSMPLVIGGGVAANRLLRHRLQQEADRIGSRFYAAPPEYCTDNGVMIAVAGIEILRNRLVDDQVWTIHPRWSITSLAGQS